MTGKLALGCGALGLAIGVAATALLLRPASGPPANPPVIAARDRADPRALPAVPDRTALRADDVRRLVAEEVRAALREHAAVPPPAADPEAIRDHAAPDPTPAFEPAKERLAQRIAQGAWTASDRDWLHGVLGAVNQVERMELVRDVLVAANTGKLRAAFAGPPF